MREHDRRARSKATEVKREGKREGFVPSFLARLVLFFPSNAVHAGYD